MKKETKKQILGFMRSVDTSEMSSNDFIHQFFKYQHATYGKKFSYFSFTNMFLNGPSTESITRSRRMISADYGIGVRTKADTEEEYREEFARTNKFDNL